MRLGVSAMFLLSWAAAAPAPNASATSVRRRTRRLDPKRLVDPMFLSLLWPKRRTGEAAKEEKQLQLEFPLQFGVPRVQPGCLGGNALGPWLCVPGFRPVCPSAC